MAKCKHLCITLVGPSFWSITLWKFHIHTRTELNSVIYRRLHVNTVWNIVDTFRSPLFPFVLACAVASCCVKLCCVLQFCTGSTEFVFYHVAVGRHFHRSAIYSKESISRIRGIERSIQNDASRKISAESLNLGIQNKSLGISGSLHVEPSRSLECL